ncbi:unnamed protein product [Closterium sp. NIES-64]|nr:unnamed protein product [Closterium sp. NIES-64]
MVASVSSAPQPMGLLHVSPRDVPVLTLGFVACSISAALSGIIFAAIPALLVRGAAGSAGSGEARSDGEGGAATPPLVTARYGGQRRRWSGWQPQRGRSCLRLVFVQFLLAFQSHSLPFTSPPVPQAVRRAAQAVERLAATAREELPGTMAAVRLSGMEISDLTMELSDLSHEISQGVRSPSRTSRLAASTSSTRAKEQHTADSLKDATVIPIRVVSPLFSSAASAVGATASTVGSTVSHVGGTVGAAASHVGGTVGAAASHVGAAASHVGGAAAHIPSVVFNLVDFLPWGHRRGGEGGETGGETNGDTANAHSTAAAKLAAKPAADSAKPSASAAAPADIPGRTNSAAPATKAAAATSASSGAASAGPHSRAPSKPVATGRARPIPSGSSPDQQSPESLHHRPHQPLQPLNSHEFHQLNENQQAHHGSVGSRKAAGAGDTRQEVTVGAAAEEHFELSSLPSLVGWLQHRKDKEKHPRGDAKG